MEHADPFNRELIAKMDARRQMDMMRNPANSPFAPGRERVNPYPDGRPFNHTRYPLPEETYREKFEREFYYELRGAERQRREDMDATRKELAEYIKACYAVAEWLEKCNIRRPAPKPGEARCYTSGVTALLKAARKSAPTKKQRKEQNVGIEYFNAMFEPVRLIFEDGFLNLQQYQFVDGEAKQVRIKEFDSAFIVNKPFTVAVNRKDLSEIVALFSKDELIVTFFWGVQSDYLTLRGRGWTSRLKIVKDMPDGEVYYDPARF